jgi:choline dehydrogenase-like flavoprotein
MWGLSTRLTSALGVELASFGAADPATPVELAGFDDQQLDRWMMANQGPVYHAVATCRMGGPTDRGSCTQSDPEVAGAVRGVDGLVVADASIFPDLVCGGLQLAVTAVAERVAAGLIRSTDW